MPVLPIDTSATGGSLQNIALSPTHRRSPSAQRSKTAEVPTATTRHEPVIEFAEPKVYSTFKVRSGQGKNIRISYSKDFLLKIIKNK